MGVVKKVTNAVGGVVGSVLGGKPAAAPSVVIPEVQTPAQQLERQSEVGADEIQIGADGGADSTGKGKRGLVRPVASSLGGVA